MSYLESLIAGYRASLGVSNGMSLDAARAALVMASTAEERGSCLGMIATLLADQVQDPARNLPPPARPPHGAVTTSA
jgi:hypothetical protein